MIRALGKQSTVEVVSTFRNGGGSSNTPISLDWHNVARVFMVGHSKGAALLIDISQVLIDVYQSRS